VNKKEQQPAEEWTRPDYYRFERLIEGVTVMKDGSEFPRIEFDIVREDEGGNKIEVGHFIARLQRVKRDDADLEDISIVTLSRINPKVAG
jgi:hypothetical protein